VTELAEQAGVDRFDSPSCSTLARDGKQIGLGTGFVVGDGLIATNLARHRRGTAVTVRLCDGKSYEATGGPRLRRRPRPRHRPHRGEGAHAVPLGDDQALKTGQPLVALGHAARAGA